MIPIGHHTRLAMKPSQLPWKGYKEGHACYGKTHDRQKSELVVWYGIIGSAGVLSEKYRKKRDVVVWH